MIICHCHAVTDRQIRRIAAETGKNCRAVGARCGAGTSCKGCVPAIQALLRTPKSTREARTPRRESRG